MPKRVAVDRIGYRWMILHHRLVIENVRRMYSISGRFGQRNVRDADTWSQASSVDAITAMFWPSTGDGIISERVSGLLNQ